MAARSDRAIAIVETRGVIALAAAMEAMQKTAGVELLAIDRVGGGIVFGAVQGSTAAVRAAVAAGEAAASSLSELVRVRMYVRPADPGQELLAQGHLPRPGS